jgi:hypothetical protein
MAYGAVRAAGERSGLSRYGSSEEKGKPSAKWLFDMCCQQHRQLV